MSSWDDRGPWQTFLLRFAGVLAALLVLVLAGTTAFMRIGGWPAGDALWMTIITVTAVGYEEVEQIDQLTSLASA